MDLLRRVTIKQKEHNFDLLKQSSQQEAIDEENEETAAKLQSSEGDSSSSDNDGSGGSRGKESSEKQPADSSVDDADTSEIGTDSEDDSSYTDSSDAKERMAILEKASPLKRQKNKPKIVNTVSSYSINDDEDANEHKRTSELLDDKERFSEKYKRKKSGHSHLLQLPQDVIEELFPIFNPNLSVLEMPEGELGQKRAFQKLANIKFKSKKHVRQMIEQERQRQRQERRRLEEKRHYWQTQLSEYNKSRREYSEVYNDLYEYSRISIENSLKPLKEYYLFNPHDFNPSDPGLMDKALRFEERMKKKVEKYQENSHRDKELASIFKQVEEQHRSINKHQRDVLTGKSKPSRSLSAHSKNSKETVEERSRRKLKERKAAEINRRKKNKHLKMIELGDKTLMIDSKMAEIENDKAEKQCQDNNLAFFAYKNKALFPNKLGLSQLEKEGIKNKHIVNAFKLIQKCVKLRDVKIKNKNARSKVGEPPLEYPYISQQIAEKKHLRQLYQDILMNQYLNDSDSDFSDFSSVASDRVNDYEDKYKAMMNRVAEENKMGPVYFKLPVKAKEFIKRKNERSKRSATSLTRVQSTAFNSSLHNRATFVNPSMENLNPSESQIFNQMLSSSQGQGLLLEQQLGISDLRSSRNDRKKNVQSQLHLPSMQARKSKFLNPQQEQQEKIEDILNNLSGIYQKRKDLQVNMQGTDKYNSALDERSTEDKMTELDSRAENKSRFKLNLPPMPMKSGNTRSGAQFHSMGKFTQRSGGEEAKTTNRAHRMGDSSHVQSAASLHESALDMSRSQSNMSRRGADYQTNAQYTKFQKGGVFIADDKASNALIQSGGEIVLDISPPRASSNFRGRSQIKLNPASSVMGRNAQVSQSVKGHFRLPSLTQSNKEFSLNANYKKVASKVKKQASKSGKRNPLQIDYPEEMFAGASPFNKSPSKKRRPQKTSKTAMGSQKSVEMTDPILNSMPSLSKVKILADHSNDEGRRSQVIEESRRSSNLSRKVQFIKKYSSARPEARSPTEIAKMVKPQEVKKFECKNIVQACYYLEHKEKFENKPRYRDLDQELILGEARLQKLNDMFDLLKELDDANDPQTLKKMFIYQDNVLKDQDTEARKVTQEYLKSVIDPLREVARIELKGNRQRKIIKLSTDEQGGNQNNND